MKKVGIIGAGKIGGSLLHRLAESGGFDLGASDIHPEQLRPYESIGVRTTSSNRELAAASDLVIAAVKPWDVAQVMEEISPTFRDNNKAVTSVAAGVSIERISESLPQGTAILRVMPNVCASVGLGSAVVTSNEAGRAALPTVMDIFRHVGEVLELPERLFDAATALHGSGPAYVTIGGTAVLLKERSAHQVRDEVMTPGGTTAAAFVAMEKAGFVAAVYDGVEAATERARRLG
ncbi:MAG: pyrroline-5-carboxylate reductase [Rubrobacteraceae bacterium]|nr:pyrroline-5-carboxylate reductase [Rubrobacteraceae bacterium]